MKLWFGQLLAWLGFQTPGQATLKAASNTPLTTIVIERHANSDITTYHLDRRLHAGAGIIDFERVNNDVQLSKLTTMLEGDLDISYELLELARRIYAIAGVDDDRPISAGVCVLGDYALRVKKGRAFDGAKIEASVLAAIARTFGVKLQDLTITVESQQRGATVRTPFVPQDELHGA